MASGAAGTVGKEWQRGWLLVLSAGAGLSVSPLGIYTMSLFIEPLEAEFGWSRALIASGMTVTAVVSILLSPFVGALIDRVGPRRIGLCGVVLFCIAFALLSSNGGSIWQWWLLWLLISLAGLCAQPTVWISAVASRFERSRGLAIAMTLCGATATSIVAPLVAGWAIDQHGWRLAYVIVAGVWGAFVLPLLVLCFHGAVDLARTRGAAAEDAPLRETSQGTSANEALLSWTFIRLAAACALSSFAISGTTVSLMPMLTEKGIDKQQAVYLISLAGGFMLFGRLMAGVWLDRFNPKIFGAICFALPAIGFAIMMGGEVSFELGLLVVAAIGIANGADFEIASFLTARYFGLRNFGLLLGVIVGLLTLVAGVSPVLFGHIYDERESYELVLLLAIPLSICASMLILSLRMATMTVQQPSLSE